MTATAKRKSKPTVRGVSFTLLFVVLLSFLSGCPPMREQDRGEKQGQMVRFTYEGPARKVCLRGDFNDWSSGSDCLVKEGPLWAIEVVLAAGRYRYGFLVDDERWTPDPGALFQEEDGFGRMNSVLIVE